MSEVSQVGNKFIVIPEMLKNLKKSLHLFT